VSETTFSQAETRGDFAWCIHIRTLVFVIEQACPPDIEIDAHEDGCRHILARSDGTPCATARWRIYSPGVAKIERVAVLAPWRGRRIGHALMLHTMQDIALFAPATRTIKLGAQDSAIPFYARLGFEVVGDGFVEAGIPHHWMERRL
jgi:predicted GNAT family N-acyltransferase